MTTTAFDPIKDPGAILDYWLDWSDWLGLNEIITAAAWTIPPGLTKGAVVVTPSAPIVWLSGGTAGTDYPCVCTITTNQGRTDERTLTIQCRTR